MLRFEKLGVRDHVAARGMRQADGLRLGWITMNPQAFGLG